MPGAVVRNDSKGWHMSVEKLIAKLEAAPGGSRELDSLVSLVKDGKNPADYRINPQFYDCILPYTTSIDTAITLVTENLSYELTFSAAGDGAMRRARLWDWRRGPLAIDPKNEWAAVAKTLPLALCIAALKARKAGA